VDPQRKRTIRLVVALSVAVLLAVALVYTSFSASTEAKEPSQLIGAASGSSAELTGRVVKGSVRRDGDDLSFRVGRPRRWR
jgi:cytochrome c-type biogenesis protein CcmE